MIGDPQHVEIGAALDQIDRPAQHEPPVDDDRIRQARGSRPSSFRPKLNSKYFGYPGLVVGELLHPDAEIAAQLVDLVAPDAVDRRRQRLGVLGGHAVEHGGRASRPLAAMYAAIDRQRARRFDRAEELGLRLVKQAAARQRIHADERLGLVPRLEAMDRREQELVRTGGEPLQRRQRVRPLVQAVPGHRRSAIPGVTLIRPSLDDHAVRPRAQRLITDRRSASFRPSR